MKTPPCIPLPRWCQPRADQGFVARLATWKSSGRNRNGRKKEERPGRRSNAEITPTRLESGLSGQCMVPRRGLEPPRFYPLVPETSASTNSATWARARPSGRGANLTGRAFACQRGRRCESGARGSAVADGIAQGHVAVRIAGMVDPSVDPCRTVCRPEPALAHGRRSRF